MPTHAELVTPERVLYAGEAEFVVLRSDGGEVMFLPHHADFVGAVDICVVRIAAARTEGSEAEVIERRAAVAGGFVHVADNRVTVLASVAELAAEIDVSRARHALEAAEAGAAAEGDSDRFAPGTSPSPPPAAEGIDVEQGLAGPTMLAFLQPELAQVRARRARARLEAAGVLEAPSAAAATH